MRTTCEGVIYMKQLFVLLVTCLMLIFTSCERPTEIYNPATTSDEPSVGKDSLTMGDKSSPDEDQSPIKGVWKYLLKGIQMTLEFGDKDVTYKCYTEMYNATAIYKGIYTIDANDITLEFNSLEKKNSSKIEYTSPDKMPKDAELKDENTIIYLGYTFKRQ